MTSRPHCRLCRRPVIRALTAPNNAAIMLNVAPSFAGRYTLDLSHPVPIARSWTGFYPPGPPSLYQRHLETCASRVELPPVDDSGESVLTDDEVVAQRDALAAALNLRTHEFHPGTHPDGSATDLCDARDPYVCGRVVEDPVHATTRAVLTAVAHRQERT